MIKELFPLIIDERWCFNTKKLAHRHWDQLCAWSEHTKRFTLESHTYLLLEWTPKISEFQLRVTIVRQQYTWTAPSPFLPVAVYFRTEIILFLSFDRWMKGCFFLLLELYAPSNYPSVFIFFLKKLDCDLDKFCSKLFIHGIKSWLKRFHYQDSFVTNFWNGVWLRRQSL